MRLRAIALLVALVVFFGFLGFQADVAFPGTPSLRNTFTPETQPAPSGLGSYDVLGHVVGAELAAELQQTEAGQAQLAPEAGAVPVTQELIALGRKAFYTETFGNEYFFTDVLGVIDGPLNLPTISKAILALGGKPTANLQISLPEAVTIGGKTFPQGTVLNTGLDVPSGALVPLGMRVHLDRGKVRIGVTCALCHATVDPGNGRILEGAANSDLDSGLLMAFATNSAAMFRQAGTNPTQFAPGSHTYRLANGSQARLPDARLVEASVDADLLAWPPGNFDSSGDMVSNPSQNPTSYTHEAWPYGWSGFSSIGWFHGLTTLNNNVHATNSDPTTGADGSEKLLGIDKETYLGAILQNAANPKFRLPIGVRPSEFFDQIDPTPGVPGMNQVVPMPAYPLGSRFVLDGLLASSPGLPVAAQLNGMSAWQNTLAPPPHQPEDRAAIARGAEVFDRAGCVTCHSGRYFTNHDIISRREILTQPSRAKALAKFPRIFHPPQAYAANLSVPLPPEPTVLSVPTDITPQKAQDLAFALNDPAGGYKVPSLIGLAITAPYLHDGGVAAGSEALERQADGSYTIANPDQIGLPGTSMRWIAPDPAASLRLLVDRQLRQPAVEANRANGDLQRSHIDGSGHNYWVDREAGYSPQEQNDLIEFLLSLDDDPAIVPGAASATVSLANP